MIEATLARPNTPSSSYPPYAWPGGYSILYLTADNGTLCCDCANSDEPRQAEKDCPDDNQWRVVASFIHWEGPAAYCDHCNAELPSEYGDPDADSH
jgi:hypothetical protein